jgi:hypothetical protein
MGEWDRWTEGECTSFARGLELPGFDYLRVARRSHGDISRFVAFFGHRDGSEFALVPGGTIELGHDRARSPALTEQARESWAESMRSFALPPLEDYLAATMLPKRTAVLDGLLVETIAKPIARTKGDFDHEALVTSLVKDGLRLLTSDEWEHACAGGARTLWRWGDTCPADEHAFGNVRFSELKATNAFGLAIAQDPYRWEYTSDPLCMRGGDGGDALCGGYGNVATWLSLASAYVWPMLSADSYLDEGFVRRARSLE